MQKKKNQTGKLSSLKENEIISGGTVKKIFRAFAMDLEG